MTVILTKPRSAYTNYVDDKLTDCMFISLPFLPAERLMGFLRATSVLWS